MDIVYLVVVAGAVTAGFVQGVSGFGFSMVAMSFWAWVLEPRLAATLAVFASLLGQVLAAVTVRRGFDLKLLAPFLLGGLCGVPLGVALVPHLDMTTFRLILGGLLLLWCPTMLLAPRLPKLTVGGRWADGLVGLGGGVLSGLGGFSGVLPTLWCTLRGFAKDTQRTVIQNFNLSMLAVAMAIYLAAGNVTREALPWFGIVAAAMLIPSLLGARVYTGLSDIAFRRCVLGLLTVSGLVMLASSVPELLRRLG